MDSSSVPHRIHVSLPASPTPLRPASGHHDRVMEMIIPRDYPACEGALIFPVPLSLRAYALSTHRPANPCTQRGDKRKEQVVKYLVNGTLRQERTREELLAKIDHEPLSEEVWALVRKGVITEHGFKIGQRPGFILMMEGESEAGVQAAIATIPIFREGWFDIEVDPISPFRSDIR